MHTCPTRPAALVLASSSPYRRSLLKRLGLEFTCDAPQIDETAQKNELPRDLVSRLAGQKARVVAARQPQAIVIGSDQIAVNNQQILGKPGNHERAFAQLSACAGKTVQFLTAVCVISPLKPLAQSALDLTTVRFRALDDVDIHHYLQREQPYDCAGSFKVEGLGITLFESVSSDDPSALTGLPLIKLCELLRQAGCDPLHHASAQTGQPPAE